MDQDQDFWELVVIRINENPDIITTALEYMRAYLSLHRCSCPERLVEEWIDILDGGIESLTITLTATDSHSQDLKKVAPAVLRELVSDQERWDIHRRRVSVFRCKY